MGRGAGVWQTTVADRIVIAGVGIHGGVDATLTIHPAEADTGIRFVRADIAGDSFIPAKHRQTAVTELATVIGDPRGAAVSTIEHLMAAFAGLHIDNAIVEIDGPEVPILDGSAAPFVDAIDEVGIEELDTPRRYIEVLKPVRVENGAQFGELAPHDGFRVDIEIAFASDAIGHQRLVLDLEPQTFREEVAGARTFGFLSDVERLRGAGFALGASLENTVVVADDAIVNEEGLRWSDEFVRHKALDAIGDLALAGLPIRGAYRSSRGGHRLNAQVLQALFADASNYRIVEAKPARRTVRAGGYAQTSAALTPDR